MTWFDDIKAAHRETEDGARVEAAISRVRHRILEGAAPRRVSGVDAGRSHLLLVAGRLLASWSSYPFVWRVSCRLPERKGERCRVLANGAKWTSLVEFVDGYRVFTSRRYLRRA